MLKIYTCYDSKTEAYLEPFTQPSRGAAMRLIEELCNDAKTMFSKYPADFSFFEIGEFDQISGEIRMFEAKVSLGVALEFKRSSDDSSVSTPSFSR